MWSSLARAWLPPGRTSDVPLPELAPAQEGCGWRDDSKLGCGRSSALRSSLPGVVIVSGLVLWAAPNGPRSGRQELLFGLAKREWGDVHLWLSLAALAVTAVHVVVNRGICARPCGL